MAIRLGLDAKLYIDEAGATVVPGSGTIVENVKDLSFTMTTGEADVSTRGGGGWKQTAATLKDASIEFEMVWDTADARFTDIQEAFFANDPLAILVLDGSAAGSQGLDCDAMVTQFSREEPLEGALMVKVTLKPTYGRAPEWHTVSA